MRAETDRKGKATPPARTETMVTGQPSKIKRNFNPLRPRGRRLGLESAFRNSPLFQPTPPTRTETRVPVWSLVRPGISTHSAREDGDTIAFILKYKASNISTHSAREDGDTEDVDFTMEIREFQPTPPARTETVSVLSANTAQAFQPTPPARTETLCTIPISLFRSISTHSAREDGDPI